MMMYRVMTAIPPLASDGAIQVTFTHEKETVLAVTPSGCDGAGEGRHEVQVVHLHTYSFQFYTAEKLSLSINQFSQYNSLPHMTHCTDTEETGRL